MRTTLTLQGHCFEQDSAVPYAPLLDLLHPFLASRSPQERATFPVAPELMNLLPELALLLPEPTPAFALEPELEKHRLHQELLDLFGHLSVAEPLVLIIEDVHWSDDSSLEFLLYLARRIASHPILLLLTYRSEEEHPALTRFLAELNRARLSTELLLSHLSLTEVGAMLRATLAQEGSVRADLLETVYALTEGIPFFIEEVLKSLVTTGVLVAVEGRWEYRLSESDALRSTEENKVLAHRFFEEQDRLKGGLTDALCAPNYTFTLGDDPPVNFDGHQQLAAMFYSAFPDLHQTIEEAIAEDDRVAVRLMAIGTHTGPFMHIPATGKPIALSGMAVLHIAEGKVVRLQEVFDQLSLMQQLGVIPPMG